MTTVEERDGAAVFEARLALGLRELDGLERVPDATETVLRRLGEPSAPRPRSAPRLLALSAALLGIGVTTTLLVHGGSTRGAGDPAGVVAALDPVAPPATGQDPTGAWRLVYALQDPPPDRRKEDQEALLAQTLRALQRRIGPLGEVARGDGATLTVTLASAAADRVAAARSLVEDPGRFEFRRVADAEATAQDGKARFDLARERQLLSSWLDGGGRERLQRDLRALADHRPASKDLRWCVRRVLASNGQDGTWGHRLADSAQLAASVVAGYAAADWNDGTVPAHILARPADERFLLEFLAIDMHERHFDGSDIDPESVAQTTSRDGGSAVSYRLRAARSAEYSDFSEKLIGKHCAILWNDEVLLAPRFESRIPGVGQIQGLSPAQATVIARILATPLAERPLLQRSERVAPR